MKVHIILTFKVEVFYNAMHPFQVHVSVNTESNSVAIRPKTFFSNVLLFKIFSENLRLFVVFHGPDPGFKQNNKFLLILLLHNFTELLEDGFLFFFLIDTFNLKTSTRDNYERKLINEIIYKPWEDFSSTHAERATHRRAGFPQAP